MADRMPLALQMCPFSDYLEAGLADRLDLVPWFAMDEAAREDLLSSRAQECRVVVTGGHIGCPPDLMQSLPALGLVAINGVGFDKVDLDLARSRDVGVSNTPDVLTEDVADLAVGLIIALRRGIAAGDAYIRAGSWLQKDIALGRKVSGSRFGILGLGRIGGAIADRLAPFGEVGYSSRTARDSDYRYFAGIAELAEWSDVLIVACAANGETANLVDADVLRALGEESVLVNISRGSVVDEQALCDALEAGKIAGAALDVFAHEPNVPDALRSSSRALLTPHIGSATVETRQAMADLVLANVDAFLGGETLKTPVR